jgi:uncharacterized protein (DUF885 family)
MEIIIIILMSGTLIYFIWRALSLADTVADQEEYIKELEEMSQYMYNQIENSYNALNNIDSRGAFEADDETGTVFSQLKQVVTNLQEEFNAKEKESK